MSTVFGLPNSSVALLRPDGSVNPTWYTYLSKLQGQGLSLDTVNGLINTSVGTEVIDRTNADNEIVANIPYSLMQGNLIGETQADIPGDAFISITLQRLAQQAALPYPAANLANNPNLSPPTTNYFWTQNDANAAILAGNSNASVNVGALFQAALTFSAASGLPVALSYGIYNIGTTTLVLVGGEFIIAPKGTTIISARPLNNFNPNPQATCASLNFSTYVRISNVTFIGLTFSHPNNVWYDVITGVRVPVPDYNNWRHIAGGEQAAGSLVVSWMTSSVILFQQGTNLVYFDTLPPGYTTLASAQAALVGTVMFMPYYIGLGATVASVTYTAGPPAYYTVTLIPDATTFGVIQNSPGAIPQQGPLSPSSANPNIEFRSAEPPVTVDFLSSPPQFYNGDWFKLACDDLTMIDCGIQHTTQGQALFFFGDRAYFLRFCGSVTDGRSGSTNWRFTGGQSCIVEDSFMCNGDQGFQNVVNTTYVSTGWAANSNLDFYIIYRNSRCVSLSAQCCSTVMGYSNRLAAVAWTCTGTPNSPIGNTLYMPSPLPAGLTLTQLQTSAPPWGNNITYSPAGYLVCANGNIYSLVNASGVSSGSGIGPSGTGSGIIDGTCVWNYVSAGSSLFIYGVGKAVLPGTLVIGASLSGSTYTLALLPAPGITNAIPKVINSNTTIQFLAGVPLGDLTATMYVRYENCDFITYSGGAAKIGNSDSQCVSRVDFINCFFDGSYDNGANPPSSTTPVFDVDGGAFGGFEIYMDHVRLQNPNKQAGNLKGNINLCVMTNCVFEAARASIGEPTFTFGGLVAGANHVVQNNVFWSPPLVGQPTIQLGNSNSINSIGEVSVNTCFGASVVGNTFAGLGAGQVGVQLYYGAQRNILLNTFGQAALLGTGSSLGILATLSSEDRADWNNFANIDGNPYTGAQISALTIGPTNVYNPTPAVTFTILPPTNVLNIVSGTWTPGLSSTSPGDLAPNISSSSGTYSQFGNQVTIDFTMTLAPTFTTATGNMRVTGLPLAAGSHGFNYAINAGYPCGPLTLPTNNYAFSFSLAGGNTFLAVISQGRGVTSGPLAINQALTSGGTITLSGNGTYRL